MTNETVEFLRAKLSESPILRAGSLPTSDEIDHASEELGVPFASDYRDFLLLFGGAMVGPFPIFGLRPVEVMGDEWSVINVTKRYRNEGVPGSDAWVVISEDHSGNPIGMDSEGAIWIHDHDFGGIAPLADTLEEYIRLNCLKLG
jgi:hypothetical protein